MATYLGPSDNIVIDGKAYKPGDDVPVSDEQKAALEAAGHVFDDTDPAAVAAMNASMPLAPLDTAPRDDGGAPMTFDEAPPPDAAPATAPKSSSSTATAGPPPPSPASSNPNS